MFLVFNKQKIYSYLVALSTVIVLFFVASLYTNKSDEIIQTVSNVKNEKVSSNNETNAQTINEYLSNNNIISEIKEYIFSKIKNNKQ